MATTDWYVDNAARAYPFVSAAFNAPTPGSLAALLPSAAVLDAQVVFGVDIAYDASTYAVYLDRVERAGVDLTFHWRVAAPATDLLGAATYELAQTLTVDGTVQTLLTDYAEIADDPACNEGTVWEMQVVYGALRVAELDNWIEDGETLHADDEELQIEPGCVQSLYAQFAKSLALVNAGRTRATADDGSELSWDTAAQAYYTAAACLNGALRFVDGYNSSIELSAAANALILNARVGAGIGEVCDDVPLFDGDTPPAERQTLDGGLRCDEVLRSFNGLPGRAVTLQAGDGVRVDARPASHTLVVTIGVDAVAGCHVIADAEVDSAICSEAAAECATSDGLAAENVGIWRCDAGRWIFMRSQCYTGQRPVNPANYGIVCGSPEFPEGTCLGSDCEEIPS